MLGPIKDGSADQIFKDNHNISAARLPFPCPPWELFVFTLSKNDLNVLWMAKALTGVASVQGFRIDLC